MDLEMSFETAETQPMNEKAISTIAFSIGAAFTIVQCVGR